MNAVFEDDPYGPIKKDRVGGPPEPREVAVFHTRSDVDSSVGSQHHTLGVKHTQGAYGDHTHDGTSSRKIGQGLGLTLSGSTAGNVALQNLLTMLKNVIDFEDTTT